MVDRAMVMNHVVVGVDDGPDAAHALQWTANVLAPGATIHAVNAVSPALELAVAVVQSDSALLASRRHQLENEWTAAAAKRVPRSCATWSRTRLRALMRAAEHTGATMIVVGLRGHVRRVPRFARRRGSRPVEALRASGRRRARRGRGGPVGLGGRGRRPRRARRRGIALGSRVRRRAWLLAQPRARRFPPAPVLARRSGRAARLLHRSTCGSGRGRSRIWRSWPKRSGGRPTRSSRSRGRCTRTAAIRASSRPAVTRAARARRPHRGSLRRRVGSTIGSSTPRARPQVFGTPLERLVGLPPLPG